ncbi:MAG: TIGR00730 family Rossman fold protein [Candidatus Nomurabacteria bacterium]|nr:TIGR00730 family Rossman fold protein [Candidatus Nomurabacteria bacterium]
MKPATETHYRPQKLTPKEIREGCRYLHGDDGSEVRICAINEEFRQGLDFLDNYPKSVTFFGSARFEPGHKYYELARETANKIVTETGYAIITGGGPGIMEGGNRGAHEAGGDSIGMTIQLPMEQTNNPYVTASVAFYYFFTRKVALTYSAEVYVYFPGGFGTMDELFEILTLVQTEKISKVPIVLMGREFWEPLDGFIKTVLAEKFEAISPDDRQLYIICDNPDEVVKIVKNAPVRDEEK